MMGTRSGHEEEEGLFPGEWVPRMRICAAYTYLLAPENLGVHLSVEQHLSLS